MSTQQDSFLDLASRRIKEAIRAGLDVTAAFDFDGTAGRMVALPDEARADPRVLAAYQRFTESVPGSRAVLVTGRWLDFMTSIGIPESIDLHCSYGLERRIGGKVSRHEQLEVWGPRVAAFTRDLERAIAHVGGRSSRSSRQAQELDGLYIEVKPASVTAHAAPALSRHPHSRVEEWRDRAVELLKSEVGLSSDQADPRALPHGLIDDGEHEYLAPLRLPSGARVDKGTVLASIPGFRLFAGDGPQDVPAARIIKEDARGLVIVVNRTHERERADTPRELVELADVVVTSPEEHGALVAALAVRVERQLPAPSAELGRNAAPHVQPDSRNAASQRGWPAAPAVAEEADRRGGRRGP